MKTLFTVLAVNGDVGRAWSRGQLGDQALINLVQCDPLPCPVCLVILRVDGGPAGMRALFGFLGALVGREGVQVAGFACRTRLKAVALVFERFNGRVEWDEGDGDRRWWAPAEPGVTWLRQRSAKGRGF